MLREARSIKCSKCGSSQRFLSDEQPDPCQDIDCPFAQHEEHVAAEWLGDGVTTCAWVVMNEGNVVLEIPTLGTYEDQMRVAEMLADHMNKSLD